jgi:hypothetical protein
METPNFEHHTETQRMNFISNLRKMFSYVGSTAKNYSELLKVMGASLEDQQSFADTLLVPPAISDYADKIVAALQAGDEDVIREFISAIGGTHAVPDTPYSQQGFLVQWSPQGGSSMFGIVTERLRLCTDGVYVSVTLLNRGEHLCTLVGDSFTPPITYPRQFGLAALMRASAVRMQAPFSFTVSIKDIITQTSYEWNGD